MTNATVTKNPLIEGLAVAMLGTTDGGFVSDDVELPAGEMYRLAAEYLENVVNLDTIYDALITDVEAELAAPGDPYTALEARIPELIAALKLANAKIVVLEAS